MVDHPRRESSPTVTGPLTRAGLLLLAVGSAAVVYRPLVNVYFNTDDFLNLFFIVNKPPIEYLLRIHGGHLLFTRNAVFYLCYQLFGPSPEYYFGTVLLTHLINVVLLFRLVERLTANVVAAALAAIMWGVCPVHSGTLGWYSVYGQVLVATILLLILNQAARAGSATGPPRRTAFTWPLLLLVASTCFGIGIGVTLVAPVALFLLLPRSPQRTRTCIAMTGIAVAMPVIYRGLLWFNESYFGPSAEGLVAAIILERSGDALSNRLFMVAHLINFGLNSLGLGFFRPVGTLSTTAAWTTTAASIAAGGVVCLVGGSARRRQLLGLGLLSLACYAIIAAGRAQFFDVEKLATAAAQPRYHYVAQLLFAAMLSIIIAQVVRWLRLPTGAQLMLLAGWLAVMGWSYRHAAPFIDLAANARKETLIVLDHVRKEVTAVPPGGEVYIVNRPFRAIGTVFALNQAAFPGWAAVFSIFSPSNVVDDRRVYFVVNDSLVAAAAKKGRRTAGLIVDQADLAQFKDD